MERQAAIGSGELVVEVDVDEPVLAVDVLVVEGQVGISLKWHEEKLDLSETVDVVVHLEVRHL